LAGQELLSDFGGSLKEKAFFRSGILGAKTRVLLKTYRSIRQSKTKSGIYGNFLP
jgi:hypothetical protein